MAGTGNPEHLLWLDGPGIRILAELAGVGLVAGDEEQWTRGNRVDIVEGVEVHELEAAG